jgi:sulfur-carrier protein
MDRPAQRKGVAAASIELMKITFKLFASLTDFLPQGARYANQVTLEVATGSTILQIIEPFGLPEKMVHLVLINGKYIAPADRATLALQPDDVLAIWPPIAGG